MTPKEARALWVKALRSGKYKQGQTRLRVKKGINDYYCCLGVACDLYMKHVSHRDMWVFPQGFDNTEISVARAFGEGATLPGRVKDWLGIQFEDADTKIKAGQNLVWYNDAKHASFDEIADIIEGGHLYVTDN